MDLEAIKSRLNAMQKTTNGKGGGERASMFWKPTVGKQTPLLVMRLKDIRRREVDVRNRGTEKGKIS